MSPRAVPSRHGTTGFQAYWKCKCDPCTEALSKYRKQLAYDNTRGVSRRMPVGPIRAHIETLMQQGASVSTIADLAGVYPVQVSRIHRGDISRFVLRETGEAIMGVKPGDGRAAYKQVPALGVTRRIRALYALGYSKHEVAEAIGWGTRFLDELVRAETVKASNFKRVAEAYERLSTGSGTYEFNRWMAIRNGWPPPLGWEDIDDPNDEPHWEWVRCIGTDCDKSVFRSGLCRSHHEVVRKRGALGTPGFRRAVERHCRKTNFSRESTNEAVAELRAMGMTKEGLAARMDKSPAVIERAWRDLDQQQQSA